MSNKANDKKNITFMIKRPRPELHGIEEIRRFEVGDGISYRKLHRRVRKAFGITTGFDLAFDEHNTTITMTGDHDMRHVTEMSQRAFLLNDKADNDEPLVWMVVVPSHNLGEHLLMKAIRWVAKGGRVFLVTAASVITLVAPLIPLLPAPHVAAIAAIAAAATAITTAAAEASSSSSQEEERSSSSVSLT
ncbi:hypothetical protein BJV82DRAFT_591420, partial [Fennellomyces sp. T-0311]